jgi:uncharacterized protein
MKTALMIAGLMMLAQTTLAAGLSQQEGHPEPDHPRSIPREPLLSVSGRGEVSARPDRATVVMGAVAQSERASEAQNQVNRIMQQAFEQVRGLNVPEEAISTVGLSLEPVYSRAPRGEFDHEPRIIGFRARNAIRVQVDDLTRVGPVIDAAIASGANQLQGVHFQLQDDREARREALRHAVEDARLKAEAISTAMGVRLEHVLEVAEAEVGFRPPMHEAMAGARVAMMDVAPTPVQPGQLQIEGRVVVRYRIAEGQGDPR